MSIATGIAASVSNNKYAFETVTGVYDGYYSRVTGTVQIVSQWACEMAVEIPPSGGGGIGAGFRLAVPSAIRSTNFSTAYQVAGTATLHIGTDTVLNGFVYSVPASQNMWVDFVSVPTTSVTVPAKVRVSVIVWGN